MQLRPVCLALCLVAAASTPAQEVEDATPKAASRFDILDLNQTFKAAFIAFSKCSPEKGSTNDYTNMVAVGLAAAREIQRRNPGLAPSDVRSLLENDRKKVESTIDEEISRHGCDAPRMRTLANNFKVLSGMPLAKLIPPEEISPK